MFHLHITLLAPKIPTELSLWVTQLLNDFSCQAIHLPSERDSQTAPLNNTSSNATSIAANKWRVASSILDAHNLQEKLLEALQSTDWKNCDCVVQEDSPWRTRKQLLCFDMDSTLIQAEVIDELAKIAGVGNQVAAITASAMRGELDFNESFAARMSLLKGFRKDALQDIATSLPIMPGAIELFATLKHWGYKTAILSGGFDFFARYLQQKLGVDYIHANELDFDENHSLSGKVSQPVINGDKKAEYLKALCEKEGLCLEQVVAVGDGANDLLMIKTAGLGLAYHAKPLVVEKAPHSVSHVDLRGVLHLLDIPEHAWKLG